MLPAERSRCMHCQRERLLWEEPFTLALIVGGRGSPRSAAEGPVGGSNLLATARSALNLNVGYRCGRLVLSPLPTPR